MNTKMKEVWVAVHKKNADAMLERLQSMGLLHLSFSQAQPPAFEQFLELEKLDYIINFPYFKKEKKEPIEAFAYIDKRERTASIAKFVEQGIGDLSAYSELKETADRIAEIDKRKNSLESLIRDIKALKFQTDFPLHKLRETKSARIFLSRNAPKGAECEKAGKGLYLCAVRKGQDVSSQPIELNLLGLEGTPREISGKAKKEIGELMGVRSSLIIRAQKHQKELLQLKAAHDYLHAKKRKSEAMRKSASTANTIILHGWVKASDEHLLLKLKDCEFEAKEPQGDNAPTLLENPQILKPLEIVTKVFGLPKYTEVDPTPYLAGFFIVSMALCLTDAGYGLMLAIIAAGLYMRYGLQFSILLLYAGIATIAVGVLIGGWWGNLGELVPLFRPIIYPKGISPMDFLQLALGIGILQITLSLLISAREKARAGQWVSALLDNMPWVVFLMSVVSIVLNASGAFTFQYGQYTAGASLLVVVLTNGRNEKGLLQKLAIGLASLYNIVSYIGDILSFSRLLALGLTSTVIATVVNLIGAMAWGVPVVGIILAPLVLIIGHLANLVLSVLSAYIHSSRLQYVEFFSRFYSGGGFRFAPFAKDYRYFKEV